MGWTKEQQQAIDLDDKNILVSAAAALVKVTTSSSSTLQGFSASGIFSSKGRSK